MANALAVKQQKDALDALNKPLTVVYNAILKEADGLAESAIMGRWRIGCHAAKVTGGERKYGEHAIESLSKALGGIITEQHLWECRRLSAAFTEANLKNILGRVLKGGGKITYSHLKHLAELKPKMKTELLTRVFKEGLSSHELLEVVQKKMGGKRSSGGRKVQPPRTVNSGLQQITKFSGEVHKRLTIWEKAVFTKIRTGPPDDINKDTVKTITSTRKAVEQMISDGNALLASLAASETRVTSVLEKRKKTASNGAPIAGRAAKKKVKKKTASSSSDRIAAAKNKKTAKKKAARPTPV